MNDSDWSVYDTPGRATVLTVTITTGWTQILPAGPQRRAIVFTCPTVNTIQLAWENPAAGVQGILLAANGPPFVVNRRSMPGMATQAVWAIATVAPITVLIVTEEGPP